MLNQLGLVIRTFFFSFLCVSFVSITSAQPDTLWTKTYGGSENDDARSIQQTSDGGYILAGYTNSYGAGDGDFWLIKADENGNEEWNQTFDGSLHEVAYSVQQTIDNGFIIAGMRKSNGVPEEDVWLIKTDENGNLDWDQTFGGNNQEYASSVKQTSDLGYILVGWTKTFGAGEEDFWLIKTDVDGNEEWNQTFGGSDSDRAYSVQQTSDNGFIIVGYTNSFGSGSSDVWLIKTDENGNEEWNQTFGGSDSDRAYSVQQTSDDGFILAGYTISFGNGSHDFWLIKTNEYGNLQWEQTFGGINGDTGLSVQQTLDSGYILTGYTESYGSGQLDIWVIKTDSLGNLIWQKLFGGTSIENECRVIQTTDSGYLVSGSTYSYGAGGCDVWLIRLDDGTPPTIPQNLTVTPGNQQITLRWNANTESDLAKYRIYRDTSSPATTFIDSTVTSSSPDTFYTDTGLINGQIYYYRITAVDSAGNESGYSNEVSATPQAVTVRVDQAYEPASTNMATGRLDKAQTFSVGETDTLVSVDVLISQYSGSASDLLFDIRSTTGGAPVTDDAATLVSIRIPADSVPTTQGFFTIDFSSLAIPVTAGQVLAIVLRSDPDVQSYTWYGTHTVDGYQSGHHYFRHPPGWPRLTWYADVAGTDLGFRTYLLGAMVGDTTAPATPQNLATIPGNQRVTLNWTRNAESDLHKYKIYRDSTSPAITLIDSVVASSPPDTFYINTGLTNRQIYYYRITAVDSVGNESGYSDEVSVTPHPLLYTVKSDGTGDFTLIQTAIDSSSNGDTVLVQPGTYVENINFNGKNIVVGSLFLTTQDTSYISQTVIDGNQNGSVVIFGNGEDFTAVLSGFTITNGLASLGGGIYCYLNSNPRIENVTIIGNSASERGGGIYCNHSSPSLVDVTVSGNSGYYHGGGIACVDTSSPSLENVTITSNSVSLGYGGGIFCILNSSPSLSNVTIRGNSGSSGGGIMFHTNSNSTLFNVTISENDAGNTGGGIDLQNSSPTLSNVTIIGNTVTNNGGGIHCYGTSNPTLQNVTISGNSANGHGGGIDGNASVVNTIIWNNSPDQNYGSPIIVYSDIQGGWAGEGNIDADPLFLDPANGDYHLTASSPCIGAGLDTSIIPITDIEGNPRPNPAGSNPDMGAYENPFGTPQRMPITINIPADYSTIQVGLNAADSTDTVLVQPGTYAENIIWPNTNGIKLISAGDSSNTIIDGGGNSSVIYMNPQTATVDATTLIQGFKITNGGNVANGGGIFIQGNSPRLSNIFLTNNNSSEKGGGLYLSSSHPLISNSLIDGNVSDDLGGGLYLQSSNPSFIQTKIYHNTAGYHGGGIYSNGSTPSFDDITLTQNSAFRGGGMYLQSSLPLLDNIILFKNNASYRGGGIYMDYCNLTIGNAYFIENVAAGDGGGLFIEHSSPTFNGGLIINNIANKGGGIYIDASSPTINNTTINYNSGNYGGGLYLGRSSNPSIISSTLIGNNATTSGGGVYVESGNPTLSNSNIISNGYGIYNSDNANVNTAQNNYWGHASGPYHTNQNPNGEGDSTNLWVNVTPWLTTPNTDAPPIPAQNLITTATGNDFVSLSWDSSAMGDLAGYKVYYDTDTTGYPYANSIDVGNVTTHTLSGLTPATTYYLAVTTYDTDGNESWYSNEVTGTTRVMEVQNLDVSGNENLQHLISHRPEITWDYYDSMNEQQTHYQIQVATQSNFSVIDKWDTGETAGNDTSIIYSGDTLINGDTYYLRVKVASGDFWSDWSLMQFRMNSFPTTPVLVYPINDEVSGTPVVLKVLNSSDAESDTILYSFNIFNNAGLIQKLDSVTAVAEGVDTSSWQVTATLPDNGQYWWTASANDGYEESAVSEPASFLLNTINDEPATFTLLSPTDSSEVDTLNPLLVWESASDPDPLDTVRYALYFGNDIPNLQIVDVDTSTNYQIPISLMDNTTYYWKVVATDLHGASVENNGGYWSFRVNTENDLPGDFALLSPENGSMVTDLTPTFLWEVPVDPDDNRSMNNSQMEPRIKDEDIQVNSRLIESYDFYLGFDSSFTAVEPISVDTNQYTPFDNLAEDQLYYWKIIAFDNDGGNTVSGIWTFWTNSQNSIPSYFNVISPINGIDVDSVAPTFTWHPSIDNDLNDMVVYNIYLGESIEDIESVYTGFVPWISDTVFTLIEPIDDNTSYYWNVVATDLTGATNQSEGGFQTFNVNLGNEPPSQVTLVAPIEGSIQTNLQPHFYWTDAVDPDPQDSITYTLNWWPISPLPVIYGVVLDTNGYVPADSLTDNSLFEWRVEARDLLDSTSTSDTSYFYTDAFPEPPLAFNTLEPQNDQTVLSDTVLFVWNRTIDPDPLDEVWYTLTYATDWEDSSTYVYRDAGVDTSIILYLDMNMEYYWRITAIDNDGLTTFSDENQVNRLVVGSLAIVEGNLVPEYFALHQNFPNPFNPITTIRYDLPEQSHVTITIYDLLGRQIKTLVNQIEEPGFKSITWDATNTQGQIVSAGVYFYQIRAGDFVQIKKMILLK